MNNNKYQPDLKENKQKQRFKVGRLVISLQICCCSERRPIPCHPSVLVWGGPTPPSGQGAPLAVYGIIKGCRAKEQKGTKREQEEPSVYL